MLSITLSSMQLNIKFNGKRKKGSQSIEVYGYTCLTEKLNLHPGLGQDIRT